MAHEADHDAKWKHNRRFLETIPSDYPDWLVTVLFYAAVHTVESLFARDRKPSSDSHHDRRSLLRSENRYQKIWKNYRALDEASQICRYHACQRTDSNWISMNHVHSDLLKKYYAIEKSICKLRQIELPEKIVLKA